jgi:hypothetical protein
LILDDLEASGAAYEPRGHALSESPTIQASKASTTCRPSAEAILTPFYLEKTRALHPLHLDIPGREALLYPGVSEGGADLLRWIALISAATFLVQTCPMSLCVQAVLPLRLYVHQPSALALERAVHC